MAKCTKSRLRQIPLSPEDSGVDKIVKRQYSILLKRIVCSNGIMRNEFLQKLLTNPHLMRQMRVGYIATKNNAFAFLPILVRGTGHCLLVGTAS